MLVGPKHYYIFSSKNNIWVYSMSMYVSAGTHYQGHMISAYLLNNIFFQGLKYWFGYSFSNCSTLVVTDAEKCHSPLKVQV